MPNDLTKKVSNEIHKFVLEEMDEQDRMREQKPRLESYPDHLNAAADAIIAAIRECDGK